TPTTASTVHYTVTFSEAVTGVDASQFSLITSGVSGASIVSVTPVPDSNDTQYTVTVDRGSGSGTIQLNFTGANIHDHAGKSLPGGTFAPQTAYNTFQNPTSVAIGDLNGDGSPDLAVSNQGSNNVSVLLGNGNGTFQTQTTYTAGSLPRSIAIGDVNGD